MLQERKFHHESIHGTGPRRPLDRAARLAWRQLLQAAVLAGRLDDAAWRIGIALITMLGADGRLDPSYDTIAATAKVPRRTVARRLIELADAGMLRWARRLETVGGHTRQTTNAYELTMPAPAADSGRLSPALPAPRPSAKVAREESKKIYSSTTPDEYRAAVDTLAAVARQRGPAVIAGWHEQRKQAAYERGRRHC
jgi:hypothetical protein